MNGKSEEKRIGSAYNVNGLMNQDEEEQHDPEKAAEQAEAAARIQKIVSRLFAELPKPVCEHALRREMSVTMPDGVKLACVAYFPEGRGPWPVILHRFPYGPSKFPDHDPAAEIFARQGYVYFECRCRGTGLSEGYFQAFEQETDDGAAVLDFVSAQDWCDGNIGTYGASYMGHTQWAVAGTDNPALRTMYIQVYGGHPYETFYRNGMIRQDIWQSWITGNGGDARDRAESLSAELNQKAFGIRPPEKIGEILLGDPLPWAQKILTSPQETDDAWQKGFWKELKDRAERLRLPVALQCGWFDVFFQSQMDSWRALPPETREKSLCLIGPWDHFGMTNGVLPYPDQERYGVLQIKTTLQWFAHFLKGEPLTLPVGGVQAYCIGDNVWRFWKEDLKAGEHFRLYLGSRSLETEAPEKGHFTYSYDPEHPVASLALGLNKGTVLSPKAGEREKEGVYSFVSGPLEQDVRLTGKMRAELFVSSTAPATAFTVGLFDERPEGAYLVINDITDIRYEKDHFADYTPGTVKKIVLESQDIVWTFRKGNRIRIDVSSSDFPWYNAHTNTTVNWGKATESAVADNTVWFGGDTLSKIVLPVCPDDEVPARS
ncbi:hypothetical protein B5F07_09065 [Lachnoclostridium sp. An169]|uniref:CocE/NonD family hydrolase n=1 Tax=Lachnoclostridium sp. An169 TaxID=1965569 RepID=UPI000B38F4BA|nr:CocE/NonD family hydrolase [Lachnoclostridium sp. An169]OUP83992.1 hypothetical protein B5F07_09065 [Lachnoclostridium sp. An169]